MRKLIIRSARTIAISTRSKSGARTASKIERLLRRQQSRKGRKLFADAIKHRPRIR